MPKKSAKTSFVDAIRDGTAEAMREDPSVVVYGLGVTDPGRVFGTTAGLVEEFGPARVFETPTAENAMTGIAVGAALGGLRPVVTHQRFDFFLLAMDQLVNSAAKWRYMFGGQFEVPVVFRLITGRGWGQGPTHSQSYHSWLTHVPGLKVVMPSNASDAKSLLKASIRDPNPVVFIENRWLHGTMSQITENDFTGRLAGARVIRSGSSITVVAMGFGVREAVRAADQLKNLGVEVEVVDLRVLAPIDFETLTNSVSKTRRLLVVDLAPSTGSISASVIAEVSRRLDSEKVLSATFLCSPDLPEPSSLGPVSEFYVDAQRIYQTVAEVCGVPSDACRELAIVPADLPPKGMMGPF